MPELPEAEPLADTLSGLRLEDLPPDHPIRQDFARLTVRVALLEGLLQRARVKLVRMVESLQDTLTL